MPSIARTLTTAMVASALAFVPVGAIAATPAPVAASSATSPWLTLGAMTSSSSSAAAALQDERRRGVPILPLAVILATIAVAIYILVKDDDGEVDVDFEPVSPS